MGGAEIELASEMVGDRHDFILEAQVASKTFKCRVNGGMGVWVDVLQRFGINPSHGCKRVKRRVWNGACLRPGRCKMY